jgi:eukaryotic-like serine/threonine-protein kinase
MPERTQERRLVAGRYEVQSRLGIGGMAEVVLARDATLDRLVALKLLAPALAVDPLFVERFRREATAIASLNHANVVVIHDHGMAEGQPFIAMEYVAGHTLKQLVLTGAPLPPEVAVQYAAQALDGLAAAHAVGIIHRDVKPQNLLVREDGTLKVADFGVARSAQETMLTLHGSVVGTAEYIAPEQARGAGAVPASDLYSLGVVLFEMLTGRLPFTAELPLAVAGQHAQELAPRVREINPEIPVALARVVDRALAKEPTQRYRSAAEMKAALLATELRDDPAPTLVAPPAGVPPAAAVTHVLPVSGAPARPWTARLTRKRVLGGLAVLALLLAAVVAASTQSGGHPAVVGVPGVVGMPVAAAKSALEKRGFDVRTAPAEHARVQAGTVSRVRPGGASLALGSVVTLVPSSGPSLIAIPQVSGLSADAATQELEQLRFVVRPIASYGPVPRGDAVGTNPAAGVKAPPGSSVDLMVSAGAAADTGAEPTIPPGPAKGPGKQDKPGKGKGKGKHHGA